MSELKLCQDCRHYRNTGIDLVQDKCLREAHLDLIRGKILFWWEARDPYYCGLEARFFEPKEMA